MANVPLKSITFPGLSDTYTVPQIDDTLTTAGKAADAKVTGDQLSDLKSAVGEESGNLFCLTDKETYPLTRNGLTIDQMQDGTLVLNGTTSAATQFVLGKGNTSRNTAWLPADTYSFEIEFIGENVSGATKFTLKTTASGSAADIVNSAPENRKAENVTFNSDFDCYIQIAKNMPFRNTHIRVTINSGDKVMEYLPKLTAYDFVAREAPYDVDIPLKMLAVSGKENPTGGIASGTNNSYVYTGRGIDWKSGNTPQITVVQINAPCIVSLNSVAYKMNINEYAVHLGQHKSGRFKKNWTGGEYKDGPLSVEIRAETYPAYISIGLRDKNDADISSSVDSIFEDNVTIRYVRDYSGYQKPMFASLSMFPRIAVTGCSWPAGRGHRRHSWAGNIARRNGVVVMNYAIGGTNIVNWYNNLANTAESAGAGMKNMMADDACHLYILNFGGVNDRNEFNNGTHQVGTIADCEEENKPYTYYGYFGRIIEMIHTHAPYAAIIVSSPDCAPSYNAVGNTEYNFTEINAEIAAYYGQLSGYRVAYMDITKDPYYHTYVADLLDTHPSVVTHGGAAMMYERCIAKVIEDNESVFVVSPGYFDDMETVTVQWEQLEETSSTDEEADITDAMPVKCTPYDELEARVAALEAAIAAMGE